MRSRPLLRLPLRGIPALCCLLALHAHATLLDNPPVTECECPTEVDLISVHDTDEEGNYELKSSTNGTFEIEVMAIPPEVSNPATPTMTLRDKNGVVIASQVSWQPTFTFAATGLKAPITLEVTVTCTGHSSYNYKICDTKTFVFGCETGACGSGGSCQSGVGSPQGGVQPGSPLPFQFSVPIGSNSQGDESTGLNFKVSPSTPIGINDFLIHSNGGHTRNGNTITTATTQTTLTPISNGVEIKIFKPGDSNHFRKYVFTSDTAAKTLTMVETSCSQDPVTHQWKVVSGMFSYSVSNGMRVKYAKIEQDQNFIRIERHTIKEKVGGEEVTVSDEKLHYKTHPWGTRLIKREIDPSPGENLTSTWTYGGPSDGLAYGKLMHHTRHDGHAETHTYGSNFHQIDYAGGRQVKTEWAANEWEGKTTTVTEKLGATTIAKSKEIHKPNENKIEVKRFTDDNENNALVTITTYKPAGLDFGGQPDLVIHPDGTATKYAYERIPLINPVNREVTVENGLLVSGVITDGTRTVTTSNAQGQVIEEKTTDIATTIVLAHTEGVLPDGHGRPTIIHHFPYGAGSFIYKEARAYSCCGLVSETDRHGVTTRYAYDALKRRIKSNRLGVTTETRYLGLATEAHRIVEVLGEEDILSSTPTTGTSNLIASETRNLAGTLLESETPSPTSTVAGTLILSRKIQTEYAPAAGLSRRSTITVPGGHKQVEEYNLDGSLYQTYGVLSPSMRHTRQVSETETGLFETQTYLTDVVIDQTEGTLTSATEVETTTTQSDWAGRTIFTNKGGITQTYAYYGKVGTGNPPVPVGSGGKLRAVIDADYVATLYAYNSKGERVITAVNLDNNDTINFGTDQITRTETFAATRPGGPDIPVIRTETLVWQDGDPENTPTSVSYTERTPDGLESWSWQIGYGETHITTPYGLSRIETTTRPDETHTVNTYSGGMLHTTESFDSDENPIVSLTYDYDPLKRPTTTLDSRTGITTTTAYLSATADFVQSVSEASTPARVNAYAYDSRGRQITHTLPDTTSVTHTSYTPRGEVEARWGSQTYPEFRTYDYAGRIKTLRTKPNFDQGVPVNTPGGSLTTWFYYTETGLLDEKLDHDNKGPKYTYTAAGRLLHRDWARTLPDTTTRVRTTYGYDDGGRLETVTYNDNSTPNLVYAHDALGRVKSVTRGGVPHAGYTYRASDLQLLTETQQIETINKTITRTYQTATNVTNSTVAGRPNGYTFPGGSTTWTYNNSGRHHTLSDGTETFTYGYYKERIQSLTSPIVSAWTTWNYVYNSPTYKSTGHSIEDEWYFDASAELNILGQREFATSIVWQLDMEDFYYYPAHFDDLSRSYDSYGQLDGSTNLNNSADDRSYTYDAIGNRLTATAAGDLTSYWANSGGTLAGANPLNQYVKTTYPSTTTIPSVHDFDGNLKTGPLPGAAALSPGMPTPSSGELTWDAENRLIKAVVNGTTVNYAYDHLSRLISRSEGVSPTTSTHYLYDGWNRIAEYTYSGSQYTLAKTFLWGLDMTETPQGAGGVGGLLCQVDTGSNTRHYPAYDLNGNVIAYFDSTGQPAAHFQYDPFGNLTVDWESNAADFPYRFSTKPQDPVTGLYYYGYRYYDPVTGRWPSRDPIGENWEIGEINAYAFILNEAVRAYDFLGLQRLLEGGRNTIPSANRGPGPFQTRVPTPSLDRLSDQGRPFQSPGLPFGSGPNQSGTTGGTIRLPTLTQSPPWMHPRIPTGVPTVVPRVPLFPPPIRGNDPGVPSLPSGRGQGRYGAMGGVQGILNAGLGITGLSEATRICKQLQTEAGGSARAAAPNCNSCVVELGTHNIPQGGASSPTFTVVIRARYYHKIKCWEHQYPFLSPNPLLGPVGTARSDAAHIDADMDSDYSTGEFWNARRHNVCFSL